MARLFWKFCQVVTWSPFKRLAIYYSCLSCSAKRFASAVARVNSHRIDLRSWKVQNCKPQPFLAGNGKASSIATTRQVRSIQATGPVTPTRQTSCRFFGAAPRAESGNYIAYCLGAMLKGLANYAKAPPRLGMQPSALNVPI